MEALQNELELLYCDYNEGVISFDEYNIKADLIMEQMNELYLKG